MKSVDSGWSRVPQLVSSLQPGDEEALGVILLITCYHINKTAHGHGSENLKMRSASGKAVARSTFVQLFITSHPLLSLH